MSEQMTLEAQIRQLARDGFSKTATAGIVGIRYRKFKDDILPLLGDIKWPAPGTSVNERRAQKDIRGYSSPAKRAAAAKGVAALVEKRKIYDICGVMDSLMGHYRRWGEYITVGRQCVHHRHKHKGMSVYNSLFLPHQPTYNKERYEQAIAKSFGPNRKASKRLGTTIQH